MDDTLYRSCLVDPLREVIQYWIERGNPTWNKLVDALKHCGEHTIALGIQQKYLKVTIVYRARVADIEKLYYEMLI